MMTLLLVTAGFALSIGLAVMWVNPKRFTNQAFALVSFLLVSELWLIYKAIEANQQFVVDHATNAVPWVRANAVIIGFFPWALWLLKESIATNGREKIVTLRRSVPWLLLAVLLALLCFSDSFIPADSRHDDQRRGLAYTFRMVVLVTALLILVLNTGRQARKLNGIRGVEMRFLVLNGGITVLLSVGLVRAGTVLEAPELKGLAMAITLIGYAVMAWAMTVHRVFDARQVFLSLGQRGLMIGALVLAVFGLSRLFNDLVNPAISVPISIALCALAIFRLDRMFRDWLGLGGEQILTGARKAVLEIAAKESDGHNLRTALEGFLRQHCQTSFVALVSEPADTRIAGLGFGSERPGFAALCKHEWATPESLERRTSSPELGDLERLLAANSLGLVMAAPRGSAAPSLLLALGIKVDQWPYTFPEVQRLQSIAELIDNILTHSRLTAQAALKARIEDLAMVSRGLAHDLKNLITPVSSFLVHTDGRYAAGSAEEEVHAAAKRSIRIMTDYVREALFFANRFEPRFENIMPRQLFNMVGELIAGPAARRRVAVTMMASEGLVSFSADAVLLQRLLVNLVVNACDASAAGEAVTVSISEERPGRIQLQVTDKGCGISPEHLSRIFEPYFTTKEFGDDARGFGLGLTICQKIAHLHEGTIAVQSELGRGTAVTVDLPARRTPATSGVTAPASVV